MSFQDLTWILVAMSLLGNYFVNKKNVAGQWIWILSNIGWVSFNVYIHNYPQATLFAIYSGMCAWGIWAWTKEAKEAKAK